MTCTAEARPEASLEIFRNETGELVWNGTTYTIPTVNTCDVVGYYKCVAKNNLGEKFAFLHLPLKGKISFSLLGKIFNILVFKISMRLQHILYFIKCVIFMKDSDCI